MFRLSTSNRSDDQRSRRRLKGVILIGALSTLAVIGPIVSKYRRLRAIEKTGASAALSDLAPCRLALAPPAGDQPIDAEIIRLQNRILSESEPKPDLERLGWTLIKKARLTFDAGYYQLAEQCSACMISSGSKTPEALLLRAHALQSLHRFSEAEGVARELIKFREQPFDYGVLGDALIDEGKIRGGAAAYQRMVDLRPDLQSYARVGHVRWLTGDLAGAIQVMTLAVGASSPHDPEAGAWAYTRLALYQLQRGATKQALQSCDAALALQSNYAPALFVRARIQQALEHSAEALTDLQRAVELNPLPEYQWALADALRSVGHSSEAARVEQAITDRGATEDPRSFSLYLATRRKNIERALQLAEQELVNREDIFTHDALAWALAVNGRIDEARRHLSRALSEGTPDARLFFHAGVIAALSKQKPQARQWLKRADEIRQMLLPSEREQLDGWRRQLATSG